MSRPDPRGAALAVVMFVHVLMFGAEARLMVLVLLLCSERAAYTWASLLLPDVPK